MKNILDVDFVSEKFIGEFPGSEINHRHNTKDSRRNSSAPKIVVYPPMEELTDSVPSPRGSRLFRALNRRLSRRARDADSLGSSSSSDSVAGEPSRSDEHSCSTSDSGSDGSDQHRRHRSTVSLRRVFQSLNLSSRSQSSSPTDRPRQPKKNPQPKRILRQPVTYTYVRGLSGLPTQRVPRQTVYHSSGLNR